MKSKRSHSIWLIGFLLLAVSGCSQLPRYQEVQTKYSLSKPASTSTATLVFLEPVFPGKPLDEIVSDNVVGAMWNPEESQKIGFTQNYGETLAKYGPQLALLASLPPHVATGMSASGQAGSFNISSRIMIPYGRYITSNLREMLASVSPSSVVCTDEVCAQSTLQSKGNIRLVTVKFTKFSIAENKVNTLTLVVEGTATTTRNGQSRSVEIRQNIVDRSVTTEGRFHSNVLRAMNKMANEISSSVVQQIYTLTEQEG